jgi:hypothetical protein
MRNISCLTKLCCSLPFDLVNLLPCNGISNKANSSIKCLNALSLGFKMLFDLSIEPVTNNFVALMKGIGALIDKKNQTDLIHPSTTP